MNIYGLVGKAGTGKSHNALMLTERMHIDAIIDDGLLIYHGTVKAGYSAKFELTALAAVRRAVFTDNAHRDEVKTAIGRLGTSSILIVGTSKRMIQQICDRLELNGEIDFIAIEDITSSEQIEHASDLRRTGMHAIPVLQAQLQSARSLSSVVQQIRARMRAVTTPHETTASSPAIVRPLFSDGGIYVHTNVVRTSLELFLEEHRYPFTLKQLRCDTQGTPLFHISLHAQWQSDLRGSSLRLHRDFSKYLQENLGFPYPRVEIRIVSISPPVASLTHSNG